MKTKSTPKLLIITIVAILVLTSVTGFLIFRQTTSTSNTDNQPAKELVALKPEEISTDNFTYQKPEGWARLSKEKLEESASVSGIALPAEDNKLPLASITMSVSDATPQSDNDLEDSTVAELEKFPGFELIEVTDTTINGKTGKKFVYKYGDGDKEKTKQQMDVVVNSGKTYFVLYSTFESDFDKHLTEYQDVLGSLKFK